MMYANLVVIQTHASCKCFPHEKRPSMREKAKEQKRKEKRRMLITIFRPMATKKRMMLPKPSSPVLIMMMLPVARVCETSRRSEVSL